MATQGTTTTTILFSDVVDSTGLRARLGEVAADRLFINHHRQLGEVVARHGGRVVKSAGDGVMAAFRSASDAVSAAVHLQRHVREATPELSVRVGAAAGDVAWEDDDCFGLPVVTAARLQAEAEGGQILVSDIVRLLASDRVGAPCERVGPFDLKGLPDPVDAYAVGWVQAGIGDAGAGAPVSPLFPLALSVTAVHGLVGRDDALGALRGVWEEVQVGPGRLVLIGGEAGAGKTRLAAEVATELHRAGACVLYGGCDSDLALPYQPWAQVAEQLIPALPRESVTGELATVLAPLAALLATSDWLAVDPRQVSLDAGAERYRTYRAFSAVIAEGCARWPTVVVLDDLHWAGTQTLALLRHLARAGLPTGVLVIGTFRDTGDEVTEPLAECLADLRRVDGVTRLRISALDEPAVERFVADAVGQPLDGGLRRLARYLATRSGGNAFYLGELWRHLVESEVVSFDGERWAARQIPVGTAVPDSVREVVVDRLARLSDPARRFIHLAALSSQRVDVEAIDEAADLSPDELDAAVGELLDAGLLVQVSGGTLVYRFAHALVCDTVVASIAPHARARLHRSLAEAIEAVYQADRRSVLAELAGHFAAAGGPVDKVAYYGRRAAAQAIRAAAYDEAVAHLDNVLRVNPPQLERSAVLVQLGAARLRQGAYGASSEACAEAFDIAVACDSAAAAADAAVGFETAMSFPGLPGGPGADMLRTALAMLGDEPSAPRATVMASLGRALAFNGKAEGISTAEEALDLARSVGDEAVVAVALQAIVMSTDVHERRLKAAAELEELSARLGDGWSASFAHANLLFALFALGRLDDARVVLERHRAVSTAGHFATFEFVVHAFDMQFALAAANLAEAEAAAERAREKGAADGSPYDAGVYGLQMYAIRRAQGRLAEVATLIRAVASSSKAPAMWHPGLAALYAELGMVDDARAVFTTLAPDRFVAVARDAIWPASLAFLAETCVAVADVVRAAELYGELLAYRGQNLQVGMTICLGPADRLLGGLAALLNRPADADEHFRIALDLAERCRSPLWTAEVQYDWAVALAARDPARAHELGSQAVTAAKALGIGRLADRQLPGGAAAAPADDRTALPDNLSEREAEVLRLIATGLSNQKIGEALFISQNTVANHVRAILRKTGCANRTEASIYAVRHALVSAS